MTAAAPAPAPTAPPAATPGEKLALLAVPVVAIAVRLAFVTAFPTVPVSDFRSLVAFGLYMQEHSPLVGGWFWHYLGPGLPCVLALLFHVVPGDPDTVARVATAIATGAVAALPLLLWRPWLGLGARLAASVALAVWPGQVAFSGVVAQDNWVLLPTVALASLAVPRLTSGAPGRPIGAGLLLIAATAIRQEMLLALLPLAVAAAGVRPPQRLRRLAVLATVVALGLGVLVWQRHAATGRWALTTSHGGLAALGAYAPAGTLNGWIDPAPWVAFEHPEVAADQDRLERAAGPLVLDELRRRPGFHALRILAGTAAALTEGEVNNLGWSLQAPGVMPPSREARAGALAAALRYPLQIEMALVLALTLGALCLASPWRAPALWLLALAAALKLGIHAVTVMQGRYLLPVTALALVMLGPAWELARRSSRWRLAVAFGLGVAAAGLLTAGASWAMPRVRLRDETGPARIRLGPLAKPSLECLTSGAVVVVDGAGGASLGFLQPDPKPGHRLIADCRLLEPPAAGGVLRVHDGYEPGGLGGRFEQRVYVDGRQALRHDLAEQPGTGWLEVPIPADPAPRSLRVEVAAINPDRGAGWGWAATTLVEVKAP